MILTEQLRFPRPSLPNVFQLHGGTAQVQQLISELSFLQLYVPVKIELNLKYFYLVYVKLSWFLSQNYVFTASASLQAALSSSLSFSSLRNSISISCNLLFCSVIVFLASCKSSENKKLCLILYQFLALCICLHQIFVNFTFTNYCPYFVIMYYLYVTPDTSVFKKIKTYYEYQI